MQVIPSESHADSKRVHAGLSLSRQVGQHEGTLFLGASSAADGRASSGHPLEARISQWEQTQHDTRMDQYRRLFGMGEVIRREMDMSLVGSDTVWGERLAGKDWQIDWEDVYK